MTEANEKLQPKTVAEIYDDALQLSAEDREKLISLLEQSVAANDSWYATPEIAQAWNEEIARRVKLMDEGKMEMIPWEEVHSRLRKILQHDD
jgi:putative addiction module component (TIGR02574 family)